MARMKVGVQLHPQQTDVATLRHAWQAADALGVDSIWLWDHFFPLSGDPNGPHFECYSLLAAMAVDTQHADFGALVTCNSYRNPDLLADMARTIDHLSEGRFVLGIGAGWFERDYDEYGYDFGTAGSRLRDLEAGLARIMERLDRLVPPPSGHVPLLIGGSGPKVTLRLVAEHADLWNSFGPPDAYRDKRLLLDEWCARVGRAPHQIERTVSIHADDLRDFEAYVDAGAEHIILELGTPFDLTPLEQLLALRG